jgi:8-oxo-dGTP pyrophosphatase MutT (NUDIX family)
MSTAAGIFFFSKDTERFLYLLRSDNNHWGLPGGKIENNESILEGLKRECTEEMDYFHKDWKLVPIQKFVNNNFTYHTFFCSIDNEFIPKLNQEHYGYAWVSESNYPKPLHLGLFSTINLDLVKEKIKVLTENKNGT